MRSFLPPLEWSQAIICVGARRRVGIAMNRRLIIWDCSITHFGLIIFVYPTEGFIYGCGRA